MINFPNNPVDQETLRVGQIDYIWSTSSQSWSAINGFTNTDYLTYNRIITLNPTESTGTTTGALVVEGGVGVGGNIWASNIYSNGVLLSMGSGPLVGTLQEVTFNGYTTTFPLVTTNTTESTGTDTGALTVAGGVGVGGSLYVGGEYSYFGGEFETSGVTYLATAGFGDILAVGSSGNNFYFNNSGGAPSIRTGAEQPLSLYAGPALQGGLTVNVGGTVAINSNSNASSTITGALVVAGGGGIGGDLYVGGSVYSNGFLLLTEANITGSVTTVVGATGTQVSTLGGVVTVWSTATLEDVTLSGHTSTSAIHIANTGSVALQVDGGFQLGDSLTQEFTVVGAFPAGVPVNLDTFNSNLYRTAKYLVQIVEKGYAPNYVHSSEILVTHDNNNIATLGYIVEYGVITNFSELGTWDSVYESGNMVLQFIPNYNAYEMEIKVIRTVLTA